MPYTPGASAASGPYTLGGTQTYQQANNDTEQYSEATLSLEQDLFSAFVLSGLVATKDGTTASQLDVTAGVAFPLQTDGTLRRRAPTSSTQSCTGHPSTTLYLDLNPDGTWSWGTAHSGTANYLPIAQVTTDASANILTVTDERTTASNLLASMIGVLNLPSGAQAGGSPILTQASGTYVSKSGDTMTGQLVMETGANNGPISMPVTAGDYTSIDFPAVSSFHHIGWIRNTQGSIDMPFQIDDFTVSGVLLTVDITGNIGMGTLGGHSITSGDTFLGIKAHSGTKLAQFGAIPSHGSADMAIGGTTYWTTQGSAGFNNSASFSSFDVAEVYATDQEYADGTLVCPGPGDVMSRCTHDGCHAAMPVSKAPALGIGDPVALAAERGETCELLALVGRVRVAASGAIHARDLVASAGAGAVRAMRPGEVGFALGYALAGADAGAVGIVIRPTYCRAPAARSTGRSTNGKAA